eukprot:4386849-Prymnesium_polylepis.1
MHRFAAIVWCARAGSAARRRVRAVQVQHSTAVRRGLKTRPSARPTTFKASLEQRRHQAGGRCEWREIWTSSDTGLGCGVDVVGW